ncbi:hypothetical protein B9Z55_001266 [Caenorhabditis nigoni]|uniref:Uncharacterized protein n=1 Tax=Caenorhabditis nigoni TaxID=1611254 RepID=A0A2G5VF60_9PELO|nr:hypothetical protein B9Z55_001266 [Caenorhabditis nigoni]
MTSHLLFVIFDYPHVPHKGAEVKNGHLFSAPKVYIFVAPHRTRDSSFLLSTLFHHISSLGPNEPNPYPDSALFVNKPANTFIMKLLILLSCVAAVVVFAAPSAPGLEEKLRALQEQLYNIEKENGVDVKQQQQPAERDTFLGFVPQKRMVAWQPMKRSMVNEDSRAPLLHAIEARLAEVLRAGERLGVNPEEVLADLRGRNQFQ